MPGAFVIAGKDLRQRFRDRSAIVLGFVAPILIATLMSFAFSASEEFQFRLGVADADGGSLSAGFVTVLESDELRDIVTVVRYGGEPAAREAVDGGTVDAALVVPAGFSGAVVAGAPVSMQVLTSVDATFAGEVARALADSFVAQVNADRLSVQAALAAGAPLDELDALVAAAGELRLPVQIADEPIGAEPLRAINYYGPSMAIFFAFFGIGFTSRSFFGERREGMLDRIGAAPVRSVEILAGKAMSVFVYAVASLGTMLVFTSVAFGADWGNPVAAALLCVVMALAVVALTALVIAVSRTDRQAEGIASVVVFGLALLGGNFISLSAAPEIMRRLALLTPNGWALRGFTDLSTAGGGLGAVREPLLAMVAFTAIVMLVAGWAGRRLVVR